MKIMVRSDVPPPRTFEHVSAHTHITQDDVDNELINANAIQFDEMFDRIDDYCANQGLVIARDATYRLSVEVAAYPKQHKGE